MTPAAIAIHTDGAVSCAAVLWRARGRLQLTVVVKAAFAVVPDGVVVPASAPEIVADDRHYDGSPLRSVQAASDLAPYLPRCDVLFTGHAYAPRPGATAGAVRLGIARDGRRLLDKTIHVYGDREGGGQPAPFARMPIVYERALGGPGMPNPVGTPSPNLAEPRNPQQIAGFGPISRRWRARRVALGGIDPRLFEAPIPEIPEAMPWEYFQAAPLDQQIDPLRGGEWIVLDGVHPTLPRLQTCLPSARGAAFVERRRGGHEAAGGSALDLVCDTLAIDGDRRIVTLTWRGRHEVAEGEAALPSLVVKAALEVPGAPVDWSRIRAAPEPEHTSVANEVVALRALAAAAKAVPFGPSGAPARAPSTEATPWGGQPIRPAPSANLNETLPTQQQSPFAPVPDAERTTLYTGDPAEAPALPFPPAPASSRYVSEEIPGAPSEGAPPPPDAADHAPPAEPASPPAPPMIGPLATSEAPEKEATPAEAPSPAPAEPAAAVEDALRLAAFPIERCAAIAASTARRAEDRAKILEENELTSATWDALVKYWADEIRAETKRGRTTLLEKYDRAYVARLEEERGPIRAEEYARLTVAAERGDAEATLAELTLPRGAMLRLQRVWAARIAADAAVGARVREAREAARGG